MSNDITITSIHPLPGYVLVEPAQSQKQTKSGLYLGDAGDEKPQHGKVLAVGDAVITDGKETKPSVKKGDQVIYKKWGGNDYKIGEVEYQFLKFDDILAIVK